MNTNEVAALLGVSSSTIKRWVKQFSLSVERRQKGHYFFKETDVDHLREIHRQVKKGGHLVTTAFHLETVPPVCATRESERDSSLEHLLHTLEDLEIRINQKADSVVSVQLLQHRREIEDLQTMIESLDKRFEQIEELLQETRKASVQKKPPVYDEPISLPSRKKKTFINSIFSHH